MKELNDSLDYINDSFGLHGEVELIDKGGKIIFKKKNMIVNNGRNYIRNLILERNSSFFEGEENIPSSKDIVFSSIKYGTNGDAVKAADSDLKAVNETFTTKLIEKDVIFEDKYNRIKISCKVNPSTESATLQELGIFLSDGTMFSRIVFDPISVGPDSNFSLNYYIYF